MIYFSALLTYQNHYSQLIPARPLKSSFPLLICLQQSCRYLFHAANPPWNSLCMTNYWKEKASLPHSSRQKQSFLHIWPTNLSLRAYAMPYNQKRHQNVMGTNCRELHNHVACHLPTHLHRPFNHLCNKVRLCPAFCFWTIRLSIFPLQNK